MNKLEEQYYRIKDKMDNLERRFANIKDKFQLFSIVALACSDNDLDAIKYLTKSEEHKHLVHSHLGTGFLNACIANNLDIVKYLLTEPGLTVNVPIFFQDNDGLIFAAQKGNMDVIKYLLTSPDLKNHANIHAQGDKALCGAIRTNQKEVIDYFLNSPELIDHADINSAFITAIYLGNIQTIENFYLNFPDLPIYSDDDKLFLAAFEENHSEILQYFIFDKNISKTENIIQILKDHPNPQVEHWFELRDVNKDLNQNLITNNSLNKKNKV
jgi:hypothetical protein